MSVTHEPWQASSCYFIYGVLLLLTFSTEAQCINSNSTF